MAPMLSSVRQSTGLNVWARTLRFTAVAVLSSASGLAVTDIVAHLTGQFISSILLLPVVAAVWFGGVSCGALVIALQAAVVGFGLAPVGRSAVDSPDEIVRLMVTVGVSVVAVFLVAAVRKVEGRFRAVVTLASDGIWTIDALGRTMYVNARMAELLGYTPREMRGRRFSEFIREGDTQASEKSFQRRKDGVAERDDCELWRKDGTAVWVHWAATPLFDGTRFAGALAVVTDLTEHKRAATMIQQQAAALERANREKEDFLAILGHELRNALGPLQTAVKLMELKNDGGAERERMVIARQAEYMTRVIEDISDVSRFMRGKAQLRSETVDVAELVRHACELESAGMRRAEQILDVETAKDLFVQGDSIRLRQVLTNLLTNAAKYTPSGGHIYVTADREGDEVVIRVRDNGTGISPEFLPFVFEPFAQRAETRDRAEGGLGLGLAIARGLVQGHGGRIEARSDGVGSGSEFIVRLPALLSARGFQSVDDASGDLIAPASA
jgi:PAS domain S-box-containing protein